MPRDLDIVFHAPLVGVELIDPDAPVSVPKPQVAPPPEPGETERERQTREEYERRWQEEHAAVEHMLAGLEAAVRSLKEEHSRRLGEMQKAAVELGVTVAAHILHDKIRADDFDVGALVRQAVGRLETDQPVTVRLHPKDQALLERCLGEGRAPLHDSAEVRLVADPSLSRGDCRAEAGDVSVLSHLEDQLAEVRQHLLGSLENARTEP